jgi:two-component system, LytTR family, sensor kinase
MIPMKKTTVIILHLGYWLMYLLLLVVVFAAVTRQIKNTENINLFFHLWVLYLIPNLLAFYTSYFFLFSKFLYRRKFVGLFTFGLIFCLISALISVLLSTLFFGFDQPVLREINEFAALTISLMLIAAVHAVIALVIRGFITWFDEMKLKEELAEKNFEMELALIKSQINPHFLFNTINNIDVLISKDAKRASEYLNKLSDILRYMVYETKADKIPLSNELKYIEKYLELQKIRTANPNYVNFQVIGEPNNLQIAPMILFPFIENAFKHTENNKSSNSIRIKILIEKDVIIFECENSFQKAAVSQQDFGGLGNNLIIKRLLLLYPKKHLLEIADNEGIYGVKLTLYEN